ncbi:Small G protein signaling modulator 2 [Nymphon striatum]|nr:Small G protein signaling modulator 2 [Nymphon striatum]
MEEAVTRKFVHEESSSITSLCAAVEACLSHGLKRRALGLFKSSSTMALLQKVAKNFASADRILKMVLEIENSDSKLSFSSSDSLIKSKTNNPTQQKYRPYIFQNNLKYLWIRLALFEKHLAKIIDHLVQNSSKYYEKDALVADPVAGQILASLLVGPCALDYSKMKTQDHFWTDPPADELVQRHRISSGHPTTPPVPRRPRLQYRRDIKSGGSTEEQHRSVPSVARDYVESLHQNNKATLLYGKNNVFVQPKEEIESLPGYLSLHQSVDLLVIKWTPNQLMNGCYSESPSGESSPDKSSYWNFALNVNVHEIVYLHCHQHADTEGTIVLVGQDGVQRAPIHFPKGGHLLAFLSCLETGLLPHGQLDPPLWSQSGKGKVFPKLKRKCAVLMKQKETNSEENNGETESSDYVFRIITSLKPESIAQELWDPKSTSNYQNKLNNENGTWHHNKRLAHHSHSSTFSSSTSSTSSRSITDDQSEVFVRSNLSGISSVPEDDANSIQILCNTMKRQIISRAFYGWLAHCRHLRTVRTHLSGLVLPVINSNYVPEQQFSGLTKEKWESFTTSDAEIDADEIYRLIYFGGCEHSIRSEVWPYLLGHYAFSISSEQKLERDEAIRQTYETTMSEWLVIEAIVKQKDKELMAAQLAKRSSESATEEIPLAGNCFGKETQLSNDVFEEISNHDSIEMEGDETSPVGEEVKKGGAFGEDFSMENLRQEEIDKGDVLIEECNSGKRILVTNPSVDTENLVNNKLTEDNQGENDNEPALDALCPVEEGTENQLLPDSACVSPVSSQGGTYANELIDNFGLNIHRIDKDVQRCDRNYSYFTPENLEKLRNIMCTYVWENLETGYVQGMCDLVAPLLVIFDDESKTFSCFCELMKRMAANFPYGGAMDAHFANMRSLIQILDSEVFELMHQNGDYTHFYFCYRWFLLDFKREFVYDDVFSIWETIWVAKHVASGHLVLFIALALVEYYRDIILENNMDFTDIIKFFNEMAEHHDAKAVLKVARDLVYRLQTLIDNK